MTQRNIITVSWSVKDVQELAPDLTPEQCRRVLELTLAYHDPLVGINYSVIKQHAEEVRENLDHGARRERLLVRRTLANQKGN